MYDDRALVGVGGWLAFFVIVLAVITPLRTFITLYSEMYSDPSVAAAYGEVWGALQIFEWSIGALSIGGAWYLVWRLMKVETWQTVRIVIAGIWILSVGLTAVEFFGVSLIAAIPMDMMMEGLTPEMIRPVLFCMIWTAYFLKSQRVANTYTKDLDESDMEQVFS